MLATITLQPGQVAYWPHQTGQDASGQPANIANRSVSIDNYTNAYVTVDGNQTIFCVPRIAAPQGSSYTVNATMSATDVNGAPLPPLVQTVVVMGPPAPPLAVVEVQNAAPSTTNQTAFTPGDPGHASVSF